MFLWNLKASDLGLSKQTTLTTAPGAPLSNMSKIQCWNLETNPAVDSRFDQLILLFTIATVSMIFKPSWLMSRFTFNMFKKYHTCVLTFTWLVFPPTQYFYLMLFQCWASVVDDGPAWKRQWVNFSCLWVACICISSHADTVINWSNLGWFLGQLRRLCASVKPALFQCLVFAEHGAMHWPLWWLFRR